MAASLESVCPALFRPYLAVISASPLASRLTHGAFWSLAGTLLSRSLNWLAAVAVARMLGKEGFGEFGTIQNTINTFQVFAAFGLGLTANKYVAQLKARDAERAGRILALSSLTSVIAGILCAGALFSSADFLSAHTLAAPHLASALRIGAGLLFFTALNGAQMGALAGLEAFRTIARVNLISGVLTFVLMVSGALVGGLTGILWGLLAAAVLNWLVTHVALHISAGAAGIHATLLGCWREWDVLWTFSIPAVLAGVATSLAVWTTGAFLVNQPGGYAEMGAYNAVLRLKQVPEMIIAALLAPVLPILSSAHAAKDTATFDKTLRFAFAVSIAVAIPLALVQIAVPELSFLPYGPEYKGYSSVVRWLMLQTSLLGVCYPIGIIQAGVGRMWLGATYNLSWAASFIGLAYLCIPQYRGAGLAAALACAYLVTVIPVTLYLYRCEAFFVRDLPFGRLLIGFLGLSGVCWGVSATCTMAVTASVTLASVVLTLYLVYVLLGKPPCTLP